MPTAGRSDTQGTQSDSDDPGFVSHASGAAESGYRVIEVWESRDAHEDWVEKVIAPNMPPGAPPPTIEYIDLVAAVPGS